MLVLFGFTVTVRCACRDVYAVGCLCLQSLSGLPGAVCGVILIEDVLDRDHQVVVEVRSCRIRVIADRNEADSHVREYLVEIASYLDVIPSEAGEVLHHDGVD